jgi:ribosomal protein S6--L-glutamate ligase
MNRVRIGFLLPDRPHSSSYMPLVMQVLIDAGVVVDVIHPTDRVIDLSTVRVEHDLYVLREMSGVAFSLAGTLHALGAAIVNPYPVSAALCDKIVTARILQAAGVPTAATYVASHVDSLLPLLEGGPIVVKPYRGGDGEGVRVVRTAAELAEVPRGREPMFAQRYHRPRGRDRTIYSIGGRLFGVKKVFPRQTEEGKEGELFDLTPELREIAVRCGETFGIDLYGVDIIESEGKPYVVDMFSIPGFKGVPTAPLLLAQYFRAAAEQASRGHTDMWRRASAGPLDADTWRPASTGPPASVGAGPGVLAASNARAAQPIAHD